MQRKRSLRMDIDNNSIASGTWGITDESVLDNAVGTIEGVPGKCALVN